MNACFITAGPIEWASSRMRAYWVAEALRERSIDAHVFPYPKPNKSIEAGGFSNYIWQKVANLPFIEATPDARHYWDVCDPSWWWQPNECRKIADLMTGIVASSQALADDFNEWYGHDVATCIPDRLKLSHFHTQRQHTNASPVRFIWFGVAANRVALWGAKANLERLAANGHKLELTIFDERPDVRFVLSEAFPIYHTKWELSTEVDVLSSHDIALLPPYPGAWGRVKSNNKMLTAWACGVPVWDGDSYARGDDLISYGKERGDYTAMPPTVAESAAEWEVLLS